MDEIAATSLHMQSRLLRVVEEKEVMRVGGDQIIPLDVRVIAAANRDLRKYCVEGGFRPDLFFRLNVLNLKLPPLRKRKEDILPLFRYFLNLLKVHTSITNFLLEPDFAQVLLSYAWPGNIRELEHFAEKTAALSRGAFVSLDNIKEILSMEINDNQPDYDDDDEKERINIHVGSMEEMENEIVMKLYRKHNGNKIHLAKQLNISRTTLWKKFNDIVCNVTLNEEEP